VIDDLVMDIRNNEAKSRARCRRLTPGLDHGIGHLVSMRLQKNQRFDIDRGCKA